MKRGKIYLLILIVIAIISFSFYSLIIKESFYTAKTTDSGNVNLTVMHNPYCGDGTCDSGESCSSCPSDCGVCEEEEEEEGGGGGGGGVVGGGGDISDSEYFTVDKELIKTVMRVGDVLKVSLRINSEYGSSLDFGLETDMGKYLSISDQNFTLGPNKQKEVFLIFYTSSKTEPGVYVGKLKVVTNKKTVEIPIILEIETREVIFDVSLNIPIAYKIVYPGDIVVLQFTIFNLGKVGKVDVNIDYFIKDFEGNTLVSSQDIMSVEDKTSFSRTIRLPYELDPKSYVAIAQVRYDAFVGTSSDTFEVERRKGFIPYYILLSLLIFLLVLLIRKLIQLAKKYKTEKEIE